MEPAAPAGAATPAIALREALQQYARAAELCCAAASPGAVTTTAEFTALFSSASFASELLSPGSRDATEGWLDTLLELRVVPAAAALLDSMLQADCAIALALASSSPAGVDQQALEAGRLMLEPLQLIEACTTAACALRPGTDPGAGALDGRRISLLEQLAEDAVARVVARIPAFVHHGLWSGVEGQVEATAPDPVPHTGAPQPLGTCGTALSRRAEAAVLGGLLMSAAAGYAGGVLEASSHHGGGAAAVLVKKRFLRALAEVELMASLSAALLAAPPWPQVAEGAQAVDGYTRVLVLAQRALVAALFNAQEAIGTSPMALALLLEHDVLQLQQELLEQVAAATEEQARPAGGGGRAGGGGGSTSRQLWPLLDRRVLELIPADEARGHVPLTQALYRCTDVALAVGLYLGEEAAAGSQAGTEPTDSTQLLIARGVVRVVEDLFPSRAAAAALAARVCASLHAHAQQLSSQEAQGVACSGPQGNLPQCATNLALLVVFRMRGAPDPEVHACLPDLLAMLGWCLALLATPAGLAHATENRVVSNVALIASCMQGSASRLSNLQPFTLISAYQPDQPPAPWAKLDAGVRAACVRRLLPTGLPRSLDRLLRWMVSNGCQLEGPDGVSMLLHTCLTELLGPLLRARLVHWRVQQQMQLRRQQQQQQNPRHQQEQPQPQQRQQQGSPAVAEDGTRAAGGSGSRGTARAGGGWRALEELGLVLTALKLLRREAGKQAESVGSGESEMLVVAAPLFSLVCFVVQLGCADHGLVSLLPELLACAECAGAVGAPRGCGAGEGGASSGPGAADLCMVAQAVVACAAAALPVTTQLLEQAADRLQHEQAREAAEAAGWARGTAPAPGNSGDGSSSNGGDDGLVIAARMLSASIAVCMAIKHLPASALLALAPQRALVALARIYPALEEHVQRQLAQGASGLLAGVVADLHLSIVGSVVLLSADERLLEGCVPGWMWAKGGTASAGTEAEVMMSTDCDFAAMSRLVAPSYAPQLYPPVVIESTIAEAVRFSSWRWEDRQQHQAEVVALARACAEEMGLMEPRRAWQVAEGAGGASVAWPPRQLRLCGHPSCSNYGGSCEAELKLQKCSGCRSVRYCGAACQRMHWPQHKLECERWAAGTEAEGVDG